MKRLCTLESFLTGALKALVICSATVLMMCGCQVDNGQVPKRNPSRLKSECSYILNYAFEIPCNVFRQAMRVQDFISSDEEARKDPRFSDISYAPASDSYIINRFGKVSVNGRSFTEKAAEWNVSTPEFGTFTILCTDTSVWTISSELKNGDYWSISYSLTMSCVPGTYSMDTEFNVDYYGSRIEESDYYVIFESRKPMSCKWVASSELGTVRYQPFRKGIIEFHINKSGRTIDSCFATYSGTGSASISVSTIQ